MDPASDDVAIIAENAVWRRVYPNWTIFSMQLFGIPKDRCMALYQTGIR